MREEISATLEDVVTRLPLVHTRVDRVGGGLAVPSSHTTVRTVPYTAVHEALLRRLSCSINGVSPRLRK